jgi:hypothetical protein
MKLYGFGPTRSQPVTATAIHQRSIEPSCRRHSRVRERKSLFPLSQRRGGSTTG